MAHAGPPANHSPPLSISTYGIVGILANTAQGVGTVLSAFNWLAGWVFGLLAVLAGLAALFAVLMFVVGRGLKAQATWARVLGGLMAGFVALNSLVAFLTLRGQARLADGAILAAAAYVLWVVIWRFRDPAPVLAETSPGV